MPRRVLGEDLARVYGDRYDRWTGKTKRGGLRIDEPGTYQSWCSITGHRAAGMKGTIVVE